MTRKWKAPWWYGHPRVLGVSIPKPLVIWVSPSHITLAVWVRVTGDAPITRVLGTGVPICISPWQHAKIYALPLASFLPFCCRARAFSISRTRLSRLSLEQASFHDLEPRHHFIPLADSFIASLFPEILFSITWLFIRHFYNPTCMSICFERLLNLTQREKVSCYQKTSQYRERRAGDLATISWGCRWCICCTAIICRSTLRVSDAGIWIYKRKCKNLI